MTLHSIRGIVCLLTLTPFVLGQEQVPLDVPKAMQDEVQALPVQPKYNLKTDDYKNDWRQAGTGDGRLGDRLRSHIVRLDKDDALKGNLALIGYAGALEPIQSVTIRFVRKGDVAAQVTPNANGSFSVKDLEPGVYSMIAAGPGGFLAWSVNVQPKLEDIAKLPPFLRYAMLAQDVASNLNVQAAAVPPTNFGPLRQLLTEYLPSEDSTLFVEGADVPDGMAEAPATADPGTSLKHHQIQLAADGRLLGRIRRMQTDSGRDLKIRQLNVFLLRENQIAAQETVAPNGTFAFADVQPGVYSLVAGGQDGFLAFSIDVLQAKKTETPANDPPLPVAFRQAGQTGLAIDVALCSPEDFNQQNLDALTNNFLGQDVQVADGGVPLPAGPGGFPMGGAPAPGGGGGGGFGGGGAGGGGGGLGGVLLGAAVGGGIGAIIDDDDDNRSPASPSSPTP